MTNRGRGVRRKLERKTRFGGRTRLTAAEFGEISGGRGYRPRNDAYTARMAQAMKAGKIKQNRLVLDIYDNNVVQRDGAHRAQAQAMLGRKIRVKVERHPGEKAPPHMTGINALRDEFVQGRQRARLKALGRTGGLSGDELAAIAGRYRDSSSSARIVRGAVRASASGVPRGGKLRLASGAAVLGGVGLAAHLRGTKKPQTR